MSIAITPKLKLKWVQGLWVAAEVILLGSAAFTLFRGKEDLVTAAVPLGIAMLASGGIDIFIYRRNQKTMHGAHWLLAGGMSSALLSLFLLFNQMIEAPLIPFFFGMWELFSGILKVIDSRELKEEKISGWHWFAGIGTVEIISGIASLLKPVDEFMGMHIVVAIILFIQSSGYLFKILIYPRLLKDNIKPRVSDEYR